MSTLTADPGFARGQVLGVTKTYYDAQVGDGSHIVGVRKVFADTHPQTGQILSNQTVECIAVKNKSGGALLPKTVVQFDADAIMTDVDDEATTSSLRLGVVDEYLPVAGVPNNEVFWLVVKGPTTVLKTTGAGNDITAGEVVGVSATAGKIDDDATLKVGNAIAAAGTAATEVRVLLDTRA